MYPVSILLVCTILAELLYVILPFLLTFRKEWRYSAAKITGILLGYLFFCVRAHLRCIEANP